jgi:hypothetical protein
LLSERQLEKIHSRLDKLEKQNVDILIPLLEIMSNASFFGDMKETSCEHAKDGQCSFFFLKKESKTRLPIATDCRIKDCEDASNHCHIELSNLPCSLCPVWRNSTNAKMTPKKDQDKKTQS